MFLAGPQDSPESPAAWGSQQFNPTALWKNRHLCFNVHASGRDRRIVFLMSSQEHFEGISRGWSNQNLVVKKGNYEVMTFCTHRLIIINKMTREQTARRSNHIWRLVRKWAACMDLLHSWVPTCAWSSHIFNSKHRVCTFCCLTCELHIGRVPRAKTLEEDLISWQS